MENKYKKILAKIAAVISIVAVFSCGVVNISYATNTTHVDDELISSLDSTLEEQKGEDLQEAANDENSYTNPKIPLKDVENITPHDNAFGADLAPKEQGGQPTNPDQPTGGPTQGSQTIQNSEDQYTNGINELRKKLKKDAYLKGSVDTAIKHAEDHQHDNFDDAYNDYYKNSGFTGGLTTYTKDDYSKIYYEVDRLKGGDLKPKTAAGVSNPSTPQTSNPGNLGGKPTTSASAPEPVDPIRAKIQDLEKDKLQEEKLRVDLGGWFGFGQDKAGIQQSYAREAEINQKIQDLQAQLNNPSIKGPLDDETMSTEITTDEHGNYIRVRRNKNKVYNVPYDRNKTMEKSNFPEHDEEDDNKGSMAHSSQALSE